jgi:hypothetical protein
MRAQLLAWSRDREFHAVAAILELLSQEGGATMADLQTAPGWRPNTISAQLTYLSKLGHNIRRDRLSGELRYSLQA